jgi:hypothetical protein
MEAGDVGPQLALVTVEEAARALVRHIGAALVTGGGVGPEADVVHALPEHSQGEGPEISDLAAASGVSDRHHATRTKMLRPLDGSQGAVSTLRLVEDQLSGRRALL